jgi:IS66 Orf2 like protein
MIAAPPGVRVYLACGTTDMRRGMAGLAMQVQQVLAQNPFLLTHFPQRICAKHEMPR